MRDKYNRKVESENRQVDGLMPIWGGISSRDHRNIKRQHAISRQFVNKFARLLMRGTMPPRARLEIRINVELPIGLLQTQKRLLEKDTKPEDIDKQPAEIIVTNIVAKLQKFDLIVEVDRQSHRNWYIEAYPNQICIDRYWNNIEILF